MNRLGSSGNQVVVPYRGEPDEVRHLKLMGDLGMIVPIPYDSRDEESIFNAVKHSNVVINLVGRPWETRNYSFRSVHVDVAERIARISKEAGVTRFIHLSCLGADQAEIASEFYASKLEGEEKIRGHFPDATILRPSMMYGDEDRLTSRMGYTINRIRVYPMTGSGKGKVQPVFVDDVAQAILSSIAEPNVYGKTLELVGSETFTHIDLFKQAVSIIDPETLPYIPSENSIVPDSVFMGISKLCENLPWTEKLFCQELVRQSGIDILKSPDSLGFELLGIKPTLLSKEFPRLMSKFSARKPYGVA